MNDIWNIQFKQIMEIRMALIFFNKSFLTPIS